jgi:hypothetical protein
VRTLYFDIDGTLLLGSFGDPKPALADGAFERAVRRAGVERLVCVGNVVHIVRTLEAGPRPIDGHATVFRTCQGVFQDEAWFRRVTSLVLDPSERARHIETADDWYWVDDLAERYCAQSELTALFEEHAGGRIFVPVPDGDGADVLAWLERLPG